MSGTNDSTRRSVLGRIATTSGLLAAGSAVAGTATARHRPLVELPDSQKALQLDGHPAADSAVKIERAYLPDGGWVVLWLGGVGGQLIGRTMVRLGKGHFRNAPVSVGAPLDGVHTVYASIHRDVDGDRQLDPTDAPYTGPGTTDAGVVHF